MLFATTKFFFASIRSCNLASVLSFSRRSFSFYPSVFNDLAYCLIFCSRPLSLSPWQNSKTLRLSASSWNLISTFLSAAIISCSVIPLWPTPRSSKASSYLSRAFSIKSMIVSLIPLTSSREPPSPIKYWFKTVYWSPLRPPKAPAVEPRAFLEVLSNSIVADWRLSAAELLGLATGRAPEVF